MADKLLFPNPELEALCDMSLRLAELCSLASGSMEAGDRHGVLVRVRRAIELIRQLRHAGAHAESALMHEVPGVGQIGPEDGSFILPEEV